MNKKWKLRYLDLAKYVSAWSKDPGTKIGAVIVRPDNSICSIGYNGLPKKVKDTKSRLKNRKVKLLCTVHGEINAISFTQEDLTGYYLFTYPFMPCSNCTGIVIQNGIKKVFAPSYIPEQWKESCKLSKQMFKESGVKLEMVKYV